MCYTDRVAFLTRPRAERFKGGDREEEAGSIGTWGMARPTYHRAATARDRDKLRQLVLEGLGWTLYRIWSTDWWHDSEGEMQRLLSFISDLRKE